MKKYILVAILLLTAFILLPQEGLGEEIIDERVYIQKQDEQSTTRLVEPHRASTTQSSTGVIHRITCYLETGNQMSNGLYPKKGYVATSDRTIPFGTKLEIDGVEYIVGDRTNKRFQTFETPTIDIFWEGTREDCLKFGVKYKEVVIK